MWTGVSTLVQCLSLDKNNHPKFSHHHVCVEVDTQKYTPNLWIGVPRV